MLGNKDVVAFLPTLEFDRARAFYVDTLGLRFVENDGFAMVLDAKGTMIRVAKVQPDFKPTMFTILGWKMIQRRVRASSCAHVSTHQL